MHRYRGLGNNYEEKKLYLYANVSTKISNIRTPEKKYLAVPVT